MPRVHSRLRSWHLRTEPLVGRRTGAHRRVHSVRVQRRPPNWRHLQRPVRRRLLPAAHSAASGDPGLWWLADRERRPRYLHRAHQVRIDDLRLDRHPERQASAGQPSRLPPRTVSGRVEWNQGDVLLRAGQALFVPGRTDDLHAQQRRALALRARGRFGHRRRGQHRIDGHHERCDSGDRARRQRARQESSASLRRHPHGRARHRPPVLPSDRPGHPPEDGRSRSRRSLLRLSPAERRPDHRRLSERRHARQPGQLPRLGQPGGRDRLSLRGSRRHGLGDDLDGRFGQVLRHRFRARWRRRERSPPSRRC